MGVLDTVRRFDNVRIVICMLYDGNRFEAYQNGTLNGTNLSWPLVGSNDSILPSSCLFTEMTRKIKLPNGHVRHRMTIR